ncbi:MAG: adenylosuccinate synthase [Bacillota bacterium]|jgi:adenylosuccinate synthase|nr:adenylosuccinate synthase [Bacillota bacterium]
MPSTVIVGTQWGDEGKGKVTDFLAERADVVVRYQGGNNAGHTVVVGEEEFRLRLVPSGILYPEKLCLLGNGMVIDPEALVTEMEELEARGVSTANLRISDRAHLILPYHKRLDELEEMGRGKGKIGTTGRGIGPAYNDKSARIGIRTADLLDPAEFHEKLKANVELKNHYLKQVFGAEGFSAAAIEEHVLALAEKFKDRITDTSVVLHDALCAGKNVLFEGAQGTFLDLDHGTYPFVTSSHPTAGGACIGSGVGPTAIGKVIGVVKAYTTRVGSGPFPTELRDPIGDRLRERGHEFGTVTGRPRRCGWLDAVMLRYAARVSGLTGIAITKLDVLDGLDKIKICTGYRIKGEVTEYFPASLKAVESAEPVYEELPGWSENIGGATRFEDLPSNTRRYLDRIAEIVGVPIILVSVGQRRNQTLVLEDLF